MRASVNCPTVRIHVLSWSQHWFAYLCYLLHLLKQISLEGNKGIAASLRGNIIVEVEIELLHFEKLIRKQTDKDRLYWFAFDHETLQHPDFFDVTGDELKVYCWVCCVATKANQKKIRLHIEHASRLLALDKNIILSTIEKLNNKRWLSGSEPQRSPARAPAEPQQGSYDTIRYDTNTVGTEPENPGSMQAAKKVGIGPISQVTWPVPAEAILKTVRHEVQRNWISIYPQDWVCGELVKASTWLIENPSRAPKKNYSRFLSSWLNRGWERHRKTIGANEKKERPMVRL